jgi:hypothetical protein
MMLYLAAMALEPAFHLARVRPSPELFQNQVLLLPIPILEACAERLWLCSGPKKLSKLLGAGLEFGAPFPVGTDTLSPCRAA